MQTFAPPHAAKTELDTLLRRALASEDADTMHDMYHLIVDKSNDLRESFGMPKVVGSDIAHLSVLKTPTEQLQAAGIGSDVVMGAAVYARASAPGSRSSDALCLFDQCFVQKDVAEQYKRRVVENRSVHMKHVSSVMVYPPLLLRATRDEALSLRVGLDGVVHRSGEMNAMLIMFKDGPIVPVFDSRNHARFKRLMSIMYALRGSTGALELEKSLV